MTKKKSWQTQPVPMLMFIVALILPFTVLLLGLGGQEQRISALEEHDKITEAGLDNRVSALESRFKGENLSWDCLEWKSVEWKAGAVVCVKEVLTRRS